MFVRLPIPFVTAKLKLCKETLVDDAHLSVALTVFEAKVIIGGLNIYFVPLPILVVKLPELMLLLVLLLFEEDLRPKGLVPIDAFSIVLELVG
jgi:hypothetical protein